ncbi:Transcription factor IIIA, partial [Linum perenne]
KYLIHTNARSTNLAKTLVVSTQLQLPHSHRQNSEAIVMEGGGESMQKEMEEGPTSKDSRRYLCKYCGISRSKKYLIANHVLSHHKEEMSEEDGVNGDGEKGDKSNTCEECGASFRKPAYLKEHLQSHSLERPFKCTVDDCHASYRRKDHLNRHLLQHEGKLFKCPIESCSKEFAFQSNVKRHVQLLHGEHCKTNDVEVPKQLVCEEPGLKLDSVEAVCLEPGCNKHFTNEQCLGAHIQASHRYMNCEICGEKQLKKNIKRHLRSHEADSETTTKRVACHYDGCCLTFSTKTNLNKHVKAVHLEVKPFSCGFSGCAMRFSFKHVRDNHEKSGCHVYTCGDFQEADEQFRSRPRGGKKRECPSVEMLLTRKRVSLPPESDNCLR